jgi:formate C-acetyltransferase
MVCYVSVPKCLELVLTGGRCLLTGGEAGEPGPGAASIASFEELLDRLDSQVRFVVGLILGAKGGFDRSLFRFQAAPFQSAVTPCAMAKGRDVYDGGADYQLTGAYLVGLATAADSLAAIRRVVFEERTISLADLLEVLRADFAVPGGEALRHRLLACPKYGNDDDSVDALAHRLAATFARAVVGVPRPAGWHNFPMIGSVWGHIQMGAATAATADGRRSCQALSDGGSPSQGRSRSGATAALRSVAKLDHVLIPGGEAINLTLSPGCLAGEAGVDNLAALLRGYFSLGGEQLQVNVVDRATLEAAQANPEAYRHLIVRVAGFCAFFTCLDQETQREIIARTEHEI